MTELLIVKYLHLIAFVYWLGGDLGTFFAANQVMRRDISAEARAVALKIMLACDMGPKLAMPLIVALGFQLSAMTGYLILPVWVLVAIWLLIAIWFANVATIHFAEGKPLAVTIARIDLAFRIAIGVGLFAYVVWGRQSGHIPAGWLAAKILIFAGLVFCGVIIRIKLKPFGAAFGAMMQNGASEATDDAIEGTIRRVRPFVWIIWLGLFLAAALGIHLIG